MRPTDQSNYTQGLTLPPNVTGCPISTILLSFSIVVSFTAGIAPLSLYQREDNTIWLTQ